MLIFSLFLSCEIFYGIEFKQVFYSVDVLQRKRLL